MKGEIANLIRTASNEESEDKSSPLSESTVSEETIYGTEDSDDDEGEDIEAAQEGLNQLAPIRTGGGGPTRKSSTLTLRRASSASFRGPRGNLLDEEQANLKTKQTKEFAEQGKVKWQVYAEYAKTSNLVAVSIYMVMLIGAQTAQVGT
jgi:ATP-binding cassette, subfamily C (CFTR/MRP), member 1